MDDVEIFDRNGFNTGSHGLAHYGCDRILRREWKQERTKKKRSRTRSFWQDSVALPMDENGNVEWNYRSAPLFFFLFIPKTILYPNEYQNSDDVVGESKYPHNFILCTNEQTIHADLRKRTNRPTGWRRNEKRKKKPTSQAFRYCMQETKNVLPIKRHLHTF